MPPFSKPFSIDDSLNPIGCFRLVGLHLKFRDTSNPSTWYVGCPDVLFPTVEKGEKHARRHFVAFIKDWCAREFEILPECNYGAQARVEKRKKDGSEFEPSFSLVLAFPL